MNKYIGHENQLSGVTPYTLNGGKAEGMRMLNVRNNCGLEFEISLDRCGDISRLRFKGSNYGYFAPCGYVAPTFYDNKGLGFLKSFTAGFFTTCGLTAVGSPCTDNGEELPLHGTVSHIPCEKYSYYTQNNELHIKLTIRDAALFAHKLILEREYVCPLDKNEIRLTDTVKNIGSAASPLQILYHCNMGYPLISENAELKIPAKKVIARNPHSETGIADCLKIESPQADYEEMCFYHELEGDAEVSLFNKDINKGIKLCFNTDNLKCFTQWKMMGEYDYVMGLEPGNCYPDGRDVMRENGLLEIINPDEEKAFNLTFEFTEN